VKLQYIGILNRAKISDAELCAVLESVNQQVLEDFVPIWGPGYKCVLLGSPNNSKVDCDCTVYVVDEIATLEFIDALSESTNNVVSSQEGDLAITLAHQVLELIVNRQQ
jgi:hypothetical protein